MAAPARDAPLDLPAVGLGTGGEVHLTDEACAEVVPLALELGYRHVDTAVMYGNHEGIGAGLERASVPREDVLIGTKVPPDRLGREALVDCLETSTRELGVDHVDVGYVHFPSGSYDPPETFAALDELVDRGTVRAIGVSNFTVGELAAASEHAEHDIAVHQLEYHPLWRQPEVLDHCRREGIQVVAYAPLARGRALRLDPVRDVAEARGVSPAAVVLAWITAKPGVSTVVKSTDPAHLEDNLRATDLELTAEEVGAIDAVEERHRLIDPSTY